MQVIEPNLLESWQFLDFMHPGLPRVVTGISHTTRMLPTRTFGPEERDEFLKWAGFLVGDCNAYFSVAPPMAPMSKKMERSDVREVRWLHVDIDPENGKDLAQERARILASLQAPPSGIPLPSAIVDSGGGYQAYWKLEAPIPIGGSVVAAEDAKLYNLQIERAFGADSCHDVCRIMRLPGTVNVPNERKRAKGRVPSLASVVEMHADRVYPLASFVRAAPVQVENDRGSAPSAAPSNIKRLASLAELGPRVSMRTQALIMQGNDPDDPTKFPSRSEAVFTVVCELVRAEVPDDVIYSVITDREFGISASVLEKGASAERYAMRQIQRGREQAIDPVLREFNDRHAVIANSFGGKCVVIEETWDATVNRSRLTMQSFSAFRDRYMNRQVDMGEGKRGKRMEMPAGEWWLRHPGRRQYTGIVFSPARDVPDNYNLWRGFDVEPKAGDCSLFLDHLRNVVCGGNSEHYEYLLGWMANAVQKPGEPGHVAVVMRGRQGSGKGIVPRIFGSLFGRHYMTVTKSEHLVGQFNAHLRDCVVLFADEAFYAGDKRHESVLKTIVTEPTLPVEKKGVDVEMAANCVHVMMASNEKWVVPTASDDRRYFVIDVSQSHVGDFAYFDRLFAQMENGGRQALLHLLMHRDQSNFQVRALPLTEARAEQQRLSLDPIAEWWLGILQRGTVRIQDDDWMTTVAVVHLEDEWQSYARTYNISRRGNATSMGIMLNSMVPYLQKIRRDAPITVRQADGSEKHVPRPAYYKLPSLADCRKHFDANFGGPHEWTPIEQLGFDCYPDADKPAF